MAKEGKLRRYPTSYLLLIGLVALAPVPFGCEGTKTALALAFGALLAAGLLVAEARRGQAQITIGPRFFPFLALCYLPVALWVAIAPPHDLAGLARLLGYGAAFWLSAQFARSEPHAQNLLKAIVFTSCGVAAYGLAMHLNGIPEVLGVEKTHYRDVLTGTFLSRNVCAACLGMGMLATATLLVRRMLDGTRGHQGRAFVRKLLENVRASSSLLLLALTVQGTALACTYSRSGIFALAVGLAAFTLMLCLLRPFREFRPMLFAGASGLACLTFLLMVLSLSTATARWDSLENTLYERKQVNEGVLQMISDNPWHGHGSGSFEKAYAPYIGEEEHQRMIDRHDIMNHAHNTYLQLAVEFGVPATCLLMLCLLAIAARCLRGVLKRRFDGMYPALGIALTALMGTDAMLDYAMEVPGIAFTWAAAMGVAWAQSFSSWDDMA